MSQFQHDTSMEVCSCTKTSKYHSRGCAASDRPCSAVSREPTVCTRPGRDQSLCKLCKCRSNAVLGKCVYSVYNKLLCILSFLFLPLSRWEEENTLQNTIQVVPSCHMQALWKRAVFLGSIKAATRVFVQVEHMIDCGQTGGFSFRWSWCVDRRKSDVHRLQRFTKNILGEYFNKKNLQAFQTH